MAYTLTPATSAGRASLLLLAVAVVAFPFIASGYGNSWVRIMDLALLYIMLALGLNIVVGFAGLLDLGYIAFYALGAYLTGLLASPQFATVLESLVNQYQPLGEAVIAFFGPEVAQQGIHLSLWVILPMAALLAGVFGALLGAPTLKLRGDYLAIVTLGFGEIIRIFMNNLSQPLNITNGPQGITLIDPFRIGTFNFARTEMIGGLTFSGPMKYYYLLVLLLLAII